MNIRQLALGMLIALSATASTAGGLGSAAKAGQLRIGMSPAEVRAVLGDPGQVRPIADGELWRYSLHQWWVGWVPHYLVFAGEPAQLLDWGANMDEYWQGQLAAARGLELVMQARRGSVQPGVDADREACRRRYRWREDANAYCP